MTSYEDSAESYVRANAGRLAAIDGKAEDLLASDALTIEYDLSSQRVVRAEGLAIPEIVLPLLGDTDNHAQEKASMAVAAMSAHGLYSRACILYISGLDEVAIAAIAALPRPGKLAAGPAVYRERTFEKDNAQLHVVTTEIADIEHFGSFKETSVTTADELLEQRLTIITIGGKIADVIESTEPTGSNLVETFLAVLSRDAATEVISRLIVGRFDDEADLDASLERIRFGHDGTLADDKLERLLAGIRQRSIAAKNTRDLTRIFGEGKPAIDKLDEFEALLDAAQ
jgi:hypothetical protein